MSESPQSEISSVCEKWSGRLQKMEDGIERIEYIRSVLPPLLADRQLWIRILQSALAGGSYPDLRQATMFKDELILYPNHKRMFSLRLFIYDSRVYTPIHDHNAWGVIGSVSGPLEVVRYRREDDGSDDRYAQLSREDRYLLGPGETDVTHPLDAGIHQTGNPGKGASVMLSVYGNPIRRLYVNRFDLESGRVYRMYPPRMQKKMLAGRALEALTASVP